MTFDQDLRDRRWLDNIAASQTHKRRIARDDRIKWSGIQTVAFAIAAPILVWLAIMLIVGFVAGGRGF